MGFGHRIRTKQREIELLNNREKTGNVQKEIHKERLKKEFERKEKNREMCFGETWYTVQCERDKTPKDENHGRKTQRKQKDEIMLLEYIHEGIHSIRGFVSLRLYFTALTVTLGTQTTRFRRRRTRGLRGAR